MLSEDSLKLVCAVGVVGESARESGVVSEVKRQHQQAAE